MMDRDELCAWLRLLETAQVGRTSARRLLAAFGSPQAAIDAGPAAWREVAGVAVAAALIAAPDSITALLDASLAWLAAAGSGPRRILTLGDAQYPQALLESADPPLLLYLEGNAELLQRDSLAVVGSRNPTAQGRENALALSAQLSQAGLTIVSGLALGVDGAAHEGGLRGAGKTIAVVGTGIDRVYPRQHHALAQRIGAEGLMLSEYPLGMPPLAGNFPQRNRIIAGLTRGTLVVEAALRSGSLITARLAAEAGRDVFAVPGSVHAAQSRGCHALIKQGAKLVESAQDILEELLPASAPRPAAPVSAAPAAAASAGALLDAMGFDPVTLDALSARTGWSAAELSVRLLDLELEGHVARLPGQLFQRIGLA